MNNYFITHVDNTKQILKKVKSPFRKNTIPTILTVVNTISLALALVNLGVLLILGNNYSWLLLIVLAYFRRHTIKRVTLRFQGLIALIDLAKHITFLNLTQTGGSLCVILGFSRFFLDHMYVFTNILIALNIQLIYINDILPKPLFELFYFIGATASAFIVNIIPLTYEAYGPNNAGYCFLKDPHPRRILFKIFLLYVTLIPGLIYIAVIFLWVVISFYFHKGRLESRFPSKEVTIFNETVNGRAFIKNLYFRMSLYPISSAICFLPYILANMYYDISGIHASDFVFLTYQLCVRLIGTMNFISLLNDPHFQLAAKSIVKHGFCVNENQSLNLSDLNSIRKEDEEYLVSFQGEKSIEFQEYNKFL